MLSNRSAFAVSLFPLTSRRQQFMPMKSKRHQACRLLGQVKRKLGELRMPSAVVRLGDERWDTTSGKCNLSNLQ